MKKEDSFQSVDLTLFGNQTEWQLKKLNAAMTDDSQISGWTTAQVYMPIISV